MACKGKKWPPKWSLGVNDDDRCRLSTGCFDTNKCKRVFALDVGKKIAHRFAATQRSRENCEVSFRFRFKAIK